MINRMGRKGLILLYHRVAAIENDPQLLCVSPAHFDEHLAVLREHTTPLHLDQLCKVSGKLVGPSRPVAITFDDGYVDNVYHAKPLLEKYGIPATVFVTSGSVDSKAEFWWDELERLLLSPGRLPETLDLIVDKRSLHWELGNSAQYSHESYRDHSRWNVMKDETPTERHALYKFLCSSISHLEPQEREKVLGDVRSWAGDPLGPRSEYRVMNRGEIRHLADRGLIDVGAHTVSHNQLSALCRDAQRAEIVNSKASLENILDRPVTSFSYPFGCPTDYTHETVAEVQSAGFALACSNFPAKVTRNSSPWELPRFLVRDWDGKLFQRFLEKWFGN
jgi:peptidoglycan/xylan/chitin deacetylase (PgdA/CDA1 family)